MSMHSQAIGSRACDSSEMRAQHSEGQDAHGSVSVSAGSEPARRGAESGFDSRALATRIADGIYEHIAIVLIVAEYI
ncbi:MAG TPA: hypothetical protein VKR31_03900 [Rhizomicrobium sp.]|nr:hypothetical protein [Rhizomicrobium sp.]